MRKGIEMAILGTVSLPSLVLGWAVGQEVHNVGRCFVLPGIDHLGLGMFRPCSW